MRGGDGTDVGRLGDYLKRLWPAIQEQLLNGTYERNPVRLAEIPNRTDLRLMARAKAWHPDRAGLIHTAGGDAGSTLQWDRAFPAHSYGFRPGRSAHRAVARAQRYIVEGHGWCVDLDVEKFDRDSHDN